MSNEKSPANYWLMAVGAALLVWALFSWNEDPKPSPFQSKRDANVEKLHPPSPPSVEPKTQGSQQPLTPPRQKPTQAHAATNKIITTPLEESKDGSVKAPPNSVPFELLGEYVVAYGDVLLGRPTTKDFPKSGFIEAPKSTLWDANEIPYSIHADLPNHERVLKTIQYFNTKTPIRFIPYQGQPDSIVFVPGSELCLSYLGKTGGNQPIYLSAQCGEREIAHEIMHALGFIHEQSRPDRDTYLRIQWQNIDESRLKQFVTAPESLFDPIRNRPFDYRSAMLYPPQAFAKRPGENTMESLGQAIDPVPFGLSDEDLTRLWINYPR